MIANTHRHFFLHQRHATIASLALSNRLKGFAVMKRMLATGIYGAALILGLPSQLLAAADPPVTKNLVDCPTDEKITIAPDYLSGEDMRIFSKMGETKYFKVPEKTDSVDAAETARSTKIAGDLAVLREIAEMLLKDDRREGAAKGIKFEEVPKCYKFTQGYVRSTLSIKPFNSIDKDAKFGKANVITGPQEHFWLSADMGLSNTRQLALDSSNQVVTKEKPASFYIGFNYKLGDVYESPDVIGPDSYKNISLKFLLHASTTPSDSMGVGVGYDFPWVNLFIARVWTKNDSNVSNTLGTTKSNIIGISFDLSRGLEWLKSSK